MLRLQSEFPNRYIAIRPVQVSLSTTSILMPCTASQTTRPTWQSG